MHLHKCTACSDTYLLFQVVVALNYGRVMNFGLMCCSQCDSVEDNLTMSGSSQVVTQLSTSATVLSHPFLYSNSKLNQVRALTHQ